MRRSKTKASTDQQIFRRTAAKTKMINIKPRIMRGGTRL